MVDSLGTTAYSLDAPGQLLTEHGPFASDTVIHPVRKSVSREADLNSQRPESVAFCSPAVPLSHGASTYINRRRVALSLQQPSGSWTNGFNWDTSGRMSAVVSPVGAGAEAGGVLPPSGGGCSWGTGTETRYIYDGMRVIYPVRCPEDVTCSAQYASLGPLALRTILALSHGVQERDGNNNPQVSYTRGKDLSGSLQGAGGIGGLLAYSSTYSGGNPTFRAYYHADGNGNIMKMVNSSQSRVATYRYDPFGNTLSQSGTLAAANVYRFSSKEAHAPSGLLLYTFRFYNTANQRWLSRDPIHERGGMNLYRFVGNGPAHRIDPLGLCNPISGPNGPVGAGSGLADPILFSPPRAPSSDSGAVGNLGPCPFSEVSCPRRRRITGRGRAFTTSSRISSDEALQNAPT